MAFLAGVSATIGCRQFLGKSIVISLALNPCFWPYIRRMSPSVDQTSGTPNLAVASDPCPITLYALQPVKCPVTSTWV